MDTESNGKDGTPQSNQAQNKQFSDAIRTIEQQVGRKLSKLERRRLHDEISGLNCTFHEIVEIGLAIFEG
ncbi:hypothetical protein [Phormidesmis sp. 146-12]